MIGRRSVSQLAVSVITPTVDRAASREATSVPGTQRQARELNPARYRYGENRSKWVPSPNWPLSLRPQQ